MIEPILNKMKNFDLIFSDFEKRHLTGWSRVNQSLEATQTLPGIHPFLVSFIWQSYGMHKRNRVDMSVLADAPWIGIEHLTNFVPDYYSEANGVTTGEMSAILKKLNILNTCKGLLFLSETQKKAQDDNTHLKNIKKDFLLHPIIENPAALPFNFESFSQNRKKRLINLGWYNRNFAAFEKIKIDGFTKLFVFGEKKSFFSKPSYQYKVFERDIEYQGLSINQLTTEISKKLTDQKLNQMLSNNVIFLNLYDAGANNAILDAIERNTPILVNRLPACEEYLGRDYPLFYDELDEVATLLSTDHILKAHRYLQNMDKTKFSFNIFLNKINQFVESL